MNEDTNGGIINDDELKLLSEIIMDDDDSENDTHTVMFDISGSESKDILLDRLRLADALQITADYGNHRLVFPVKMNKGDFNNFSMVVQSPKIFEKGDQLHPWKLRSWRMLPDKSICLVNQQGEVLKYQIRDLSVSGLCLLIDDEDQIDFPERLDHIYLQLPNYERLAISATQARRIDKKTVAYSLGGSTDEAVLASLSEYLFSCHVKQHPQVHKDINDLMHI